MGQAPYAGRDLRELIQTPAGTGEDTEASTESRSPVARAFLPASQCPLRRGLQFFLHHFLLPLSLNSNFPSFISFVKRLVWSQASRANFHLCSIPVGSCPGYVSWRRTPGLGLLGTTPANSHFLCFCKMGTDQDLCPFSKPEVCLVIRPRVSIEFSGAPGTV